MSTSDKLTQMIVECIREFKEEQRGTSAATIIHYVRQKESKTGVEEVRVAMRNAVSSGVIVASGYVNRYKLRAAPV
jgi:hypothetical protein